MAITEWLSPKSITSLRGFFGLTGYYRRFVHNYAQIVALLISLSKRDAFRWDKDAETCFEQLKVVMTSTLVFAALDFTKTFILECDTSGTGLGVFLMQDKHPIAFESRKLKPSEKTKPHLRRKCWK